MDSTYGIPPMIAAPPPPGQPMQPLPGQQQPQDISQLLSQLTPEELHQVIQSSTGGQQSGVDEKKRQQANSERVTRAPMGAFQGIAQGLTNGLSDLRSALALKDEQNVVNQAGDAHQMLGSKIADALRSAQALRGMGPGQAPAYGPQPAQTLPDPGPSAEMV